MKIDRSLYHSLKMKVPLSDIKHKILKPQDTNYMIKVTICDRILFIKIVLDGLTDLSFTHLNLKPSDVTSESHDGADT